MIPSPKKTRIGDNIVHCSSFESGIQLTLNKTDCYTRIRGDDFILPVGFIAKCKDMIDNHSEQIRSWFNPAPSLSTIQNVTHLPESVSWDHTYDKNLNKIILSVKGIIVESSRILPYITLDYVEQTSQNLTQSLSLISSFEDEIQEITDDIIVRDIENNGDDDGDDDEDDDGDEDEDEDEDDDEDDEDRFERVQRNLDAAREELERLRRKHYRY
jgi:hypothetical protein